MAISPEVVSPGNNAELCIKTNSGFPPAKNYFLRLPMILIRCELKLETKDGRVIRQYADPGKENNCSFPVKGRGAYYSNPVSGQDDRFVISDVPGFFGISLPVHQNEGIRLLAAPSPAEELISLSLKSGGTEEKAGFHFRKSDDLTNHRPYVPGDDPRRINWKLYSHAPLGDLFVREGEPEPPPYSRLLILVDTEVDCSLYTADKGRRAVDMLCETAFAAALEYKLKGMDIRIGYTGGRIMGGKDEPRNLSAPKNIPESSGSMELASFLALPYAIFRNERTSSSGPMAELPGAELPPAPDDTAILILALPRSFAETAADSPSALDKFIKKRETKKEVDIIFLCNTEQDYAAQVCVNLYNGRSGIHAAKMVFPDLKKKESDGIA
jgi:hypothetical protein